MALVDAQVNGTPFAGRIGCTGRLTVTAVYSQVIKGGLQRHEIWTVDERYNPKMARRVFSTVNDWRASLCQRAIDLGVQVDARWIETQYGEELIDVSLSA